MKEFIRKYGDLILLVFFQLVLGRIASFLPLGITALVAGIWVMKRKSDHLLILFLLMVVLGDSRMPSLEFYKNLRIVVILMLFLRTLLDISSKKYPFNRAYLLLIPFIIFACISMMRSPNILFGLPKMISYFFVLFIAVHFLPYYLSKNRGQLISDIVYLVIFILGMGILFIVINPNVAFVAGRYRGLMGNPNGLGIYCSLIFPLMVYVTVFNSKHKSAAQFAIFLIFISIILCQSRTAMATIFIFFSLYIFYRGKRWKRSMLWFLVIPFATLFFSIVSLETLVELVGLKEYLRFDSLATGTGRFLAWSLAIDEIFENLFFGRGFGYELLFFKQFQAMFLGTEHQGTMHNSYLTFLMNIGLLGLISIFVFYFSLFRKIKAPGYSFPFVIAMLTSANFENWMVSSLNSWTIIFLISLITFIQHPKIQHL